MVVRRRSRLLRKDDFFGLKNCGWGFKFLRRAARWRLGEGDVDAGEERWEGRQAVRGCPWRRSRSKEGRAGTVW